MLKQRKIYENFWKAFQCSSGFLVLFVAYNSAINLQSTVMDRAGFGKLGFYNLALISLFCALGGLLSTSVTSKIGTNVSLFLGAIMNAAWIATSILPTLRNEEKDP